MKKSIKVFTTFAIFVVICALICLFVRQWCKYEVITVNENTASIRVPGEFEEPVGLIYNSEYVTVANDNSVITLNFNKQGYYYVRILNHRYIFCYLTENNDNYTVDLLEHEYKDILKIIANERMLWEIVISVVVLAVIITLIILKHTKNSNRLKVEKTKNKTVVQSPSTD